MCYELPEFLLLNLFYFLFACFRSTIMFQNKECEASVEDVAISFGPRGMLRSNVAECALYCLRAKYQGSDKLILPYWVCVSQPYSDFFSVLFLTILVKICLSHFFIFICWCYLHILGQDFQRSIRFPCEEVLLGDWSR